MMETQQTYPGLAHAAALTAEAEADAAAKRAKRGKHEGATLLQPGDVFVCPSLAKARYGTSHSIPGFVDRSRLEVGYGSSVVTMVWTETQEGGWSRQRHEDVNVDATDPGRGTAEFVAVRAAMEGGGYGHGPHDYYPPGWHVTARRLGPDGTYDPDGETVRFTQSGAFNTRLDDVVWVRHMGLSAEVRLAALEDR